MDNLTPDQLAKAERLWQELLAENLACRQLTDDLDRRQMRIRRISDELGELVPRSPAKPCSCKWAPLGSFRTSIDPLCAAHPTTSQSESLRAV